MKTKENLTQWEQMMVDYGFFHQDKTNIILHMIFVPIIVLSVMIPLAFISIFNFSIAGIVIPINGALLATIALSLFYISLDKKLGWISLPILFGLWICANQFTAYGFSTAGIIALVGFVGGFAFQFVGHAIEGKKPALAAYNPAVAMLSSPLFVVAEYAKIFGVHKALWAKANQVIAELEAQKG